jgi:predicted GNAT family N-acyltransferase
MELDYTDRTSIPLCLFSANGEVLGCSRLVKEVGKDEHQYVAYVQQLVDSANDPTLKDNFNLPRQLRQPFDVLEEFQGFREYYSELVKARTAVGEVSRVIVRPAYERKGIGEALVDCIVDMSARRHVQRLFLACQEGHVHLYGRSGFTVCRGLRSNRFLHIPQPSVIMERSLAV